MMRVGTLAHEADFEGWRRAARALATEGVPPHRVAWRVGEAGPGLLDGPRVEGGDAPAFAVPKEFVEAARRVVCHRDPGRLDLLYRLLWRLRTERGLLENAVDRDVARLRTLDKAIRRDVHKMHAFVRFRAVEGEAAETFVAWFEPTHRIVRVGTPFFMRRFAQMRWSILTPDECAHWDGESLRFTPGADRRDAPDADALEAMWKAYYRSIFNPARLKTKAMCAEMPKKFWRNLPEAELIAPLIASARKEEAAMLDADPTDPRREAEYVFEEEVEPGDALADLRAKCQSCLVCDHACDATQAVFGIGPATARLMVVGEQPGDREDIAGRPFVGPAGELFSAAMDQAGMSREDIYLTNAVKHFRYELRGKRRIHQAPKVSHIDNCRFWLKAERKLVRPAFTLAMGATAIRALHGKPMKVGEARANGFTCFDGGEAAASLHPAAVLRQPDEESRERAFESLVGDLTKARDRIEAIAKAA